MKFKIFLVVLILCVGFISADFVEGNPLFNIEKNYSIDDSIQGWINIGLSNEPIDSLFKTSEGDEIKLIDLLDLNNLSGDCGVEDCEISYIRNLSEPVKEFELARNEIDLVGFEFNEDIEAITEIDFRISSDVSQSCYNQLKIDLFNNGDVDILNTAFSDDFCTLFRTRGCFDTSVAVEEAVLSSSKPYCQRMELPESNGFRLGADVSGEGFMKMELRDLDGTSLDSCQDVEVTGDGEFFCEINYDSIETKEYYVCIYGDSTVKLKYYSGEDSCGFFGIPPLEEKFSYNIVAYSKQFGVFEDYVLSRDYSFDYVAEVQDYLISKYGDLDCGSHECIVPIKIISGDNQKVNFSDLKLKYETVGALRSFTDVNFSNLEEDVMDLNLDAQKIILDYADFQVPQSYGEKTFSLELGGNEIFSQKINILRKPFIQSVTPSVVVAAIPSEFVATVLTTASNTSIKKYFWDFETNSFGTEDNKIFYTFNSTGVFNLTLTVIDSNDLNSSRKFSIKVDTPRNSVDLILKKKLDNIDKMNEFASSLEGFYQTTLKKELNLVDNENVLIAIKDDFDTANSNEEDSYYISLVERLNSVSVPDSITVSKDGENLDFYFDEDQINLEALADLSGNYSSGKKQEYKDAILSWMHNYLDNEIAFKEVSVDYGGGLNVLLNFFELEVSSENSPAEEYIILEKLEGLEFEKNYNQIEKENYFYIPVEGSKKIVFSTTEDISFVNLPVFISPRLEQLPVLEDVSEEPNYFKWIILSLVVFVALILIVVIYFFTHRWYKKRYEDYLFPNKNDLYNLVSFIESSKRSGKSDKEIKKSLKKSGWSGEQLRYIIRKYLGKSTGLFEIPINKFLKFDKKIPPKPIQKPFPMNRPVFRRGFRKM